MYRTKGPSAGRAWFQAPGRAGARRMRRWCGGRWSCRARWCSRAGCPAAC